MSQKLAGEEGGLKKGAFPVTKAGSRNLKVLLKNAILSSLPIEMSTRKRMIAFVNASMVHET